MGERHHHLCEAHQHLFDGTAKEARHRTDHHTQRYCQGVRQDTHQQADPRTVDDTAQQVAAIGICAEWKAHISL